jgi:hypothetical protein
MQGFEPKLFHEFRLELIHRLGDLILKLLEAA